MFYLVQQDVNDPRRADRLDVISSHPTAAEAFAAAQRRRSILPRLGLSTDAVHLVVVGEDGSVVSRDRLGRDARTTFLPTILWRLLGRDGTRAQAMLVPNARTCTLVWWFDDIQPFARELANCDEALALAEELRAEFQAREFIDMR
jgi:hypothetical protein